MYYFSFASKVVELSLKLGASKLICRIGYHCHCRNSKSCLSRHLVRFTVDACTSLLGMMRTAFIYEFCFYLTSVVFLREVQVLTPELPQNLHTRIRRKASPKNEKLKRGALIRHVLFTVVHSRFMNNLLVFKVKNLYICPYMAVHLIIRKLNW